MASCELNANSASGLFVEFHRDQVLAVQGRGQAVLATDEGRNLVVARLPHMHGVAHPQPRVGLLRCRWHLGC